MSLFQPYRPRRPTRAENEKNEEQLQYNRERQGKKRARERERLEERSVAVLLSNRTLPRLITICLQIFQDAVQRAQWYRLPG